MMKPNGHCEWEPTEFNIIVQPDVVEAKTAGGIFIPDKSKEVDQHAKAIGTLVAVSPLAFNYEQWPEGARKPQPGDRVMFAKYAGSLLDVDKPDGYRIMKDKDLLAVKN